MLAKNMEEIKTEIPIEVIDIDEHSDTAIEYGIRGVPTLVKIDENNNIIKKHVGMASLKQLQDWFDND
jgi:thioredoxin-like negative regulator of GroEL